MRKLLIFISLSLFISSCSWLNPSIMLRTDKSFQYTKNPDSVNAVEYKISANDILEFSIYSNDGFKLVDLTSLNSANMGYRFESNIEYLVEADGFVKLPILGRVKIAGLTIRESEIFLEEKYAAFYVRPYVILSVSNKRVIVFPGSAGDAKVIPLKNNNTTLIEALALAGGIADHGKARMVKLIRKNGDKYDVYHMDLSVIAGIKDATMVLQAGDLIYVEPQRRYASRLLAEVAPIVSLLTSTFVLFTYTQALRK